MANTFELIASSTVGSGGAANIDFTSIPSTYTDLQLVLSARGTSTALYANIKLNNSSSAIYSLRTIYGDGSAAASQNDSGATYFERFLMVSSAYTANTFSNGMLYIPNYAGSTNKSVMFDSVNENNATSSQMFMVAGLWASTAAINQITLTPNTGNFAQYSTAYLYGVKNA
jgi:hypothetical protein